MKNSKLSFLFLLALVALPLTVFSLLQNQDSRSKAQSATNVSGLPWKSGAVSDDSAGFATWRGRPYDVITTWPNRETWEIVRNPDIYGAISDLSGVPMLTIGIAMLPEQGGATWAQCATGAYDQYFRDIGAKLASVNRGDATVRLGWEANGDWYAWSIRDDVTNYKACFRRQVQAMRSTAPNLKIDWNMNKESKMSQSVANAYPGDDVVDIIGVDFYSMWPGYPDQAAWNADYMALQNGGPRGLGAWLAFAKSHGKKLSIPEWGVNNGTGGGGDDAFYIEAMYNFFTANASDIAYEIYFNTMDPGFVIFPAGRNPNASAKYRELWNRAVTPGTGGVTQAPTTAVPTIMAPTLITPTIYCVGGVGEPPCAPISPTNSVVPTAGTGTTTPVSPTAGGTNPTSNPSPTISPCATDTLASIMHNKGKQKKKFRANNQGGFLEQFLQFLFKLIEWLLQKIGTPIPTDPGTPIVTPTPCPDPTGAVESATTERESTVNATPTVFESPVNNR